MARLLRIIGEGEVRIIENREYCGVNLAELDMGQLEELQFRIANEIERRMETASGKVEIDWCGEWNGDPETKKPYLAVLLPIPKDAALAWNQNYAHKRPYTYKFLSLVREKDDPLKFYFWGYLKFGLVLKGRIFIGQDIFYKVSSEGLKQIGEGEAIKLLSRFDQSFIEELENDLQKNFT